VDTSRWYLECRHLTYQISGMAAQEPSSLVKVKGLISQMVEKLMAEANAEASQKASCDKEKAKRSTSKEEKPRSSTSTSRAPTRPRRPWRPWRSP